MLGQCHTIRGTFQYVKRIRDVISYLDWWIWTNGSTVLVQNHGKHKQNCMGIQRII